MIRHTRCCVRLLVLSRTRRHNSRSEHHNDLVCRQVFILTCHGSFVYAVTLSFVQNNHSETQRVVALSTSDLRKSPCTELANSPRPAAHVGADHSTLRKRGRRLILPRRCPHRRTASTLCCKHPGLPALRSAACHRRILLCRAEKQQHSVKRMRHGTTAKTEHSTDPRRTKTKKQLIVLC